MAEEEEFESPRPLTARSLSKRVRSPIRLFLQEQRGATQARTGSPYPARVVRYQLRHSPSEGTHGSPCYLYYVSSEGFEPSYRFSGSGDPPCIPSSTNQTPSPPPLILVHRGSNLLFHYGTVTPADASAGTTIIPVPYINLRDSRRTLHSPGV